MFLRLALISCVLLCSCGTQVSPTSTETPAAASPWTGKTLTVAYANEEPYGFLNAEGRVTGEAPEVLRAVAKTLGFAEVTFVPVEWKGLIPGLIAKRFDVVAAGMYITPERAANVAFTRPTYRIGEAMLVARGNPQGITGYKRFVEQADLRLGVVKGTVEVGYASDAGIPESQVVVFNDNASALAGVRAGQVQAFAGTALTIQVIVDKLGAEADVERAQPFIQPEKNGVAVYGYGAFALHHERQDLCQAINQVLIDFLDSEPHRALVAPFGFSAAESAGGMSAEDVLALGR